MELYGETPAPGPITRERLEFVRELANHARLQVENFDTYTKEHGIRVGHWAKVIASRLPSFDKERLMRLEISAIIHDFGKMDVPPDVLNKPSKLSPEEFDKIKIHPETGATRCEVIAPYVSLDAILCHHVHFNGGGYPNLGLKGHDIPLEARIVSVADVFDACTSDRCYRKGMAPGKAMQILKEVAGSQLDPQLVNIFERYYQTQQSARGQDVGFVTMTIDAAMGEEIRMAKRYLRKHVGDYDSTNPLAKISKKDEFVKDAIAQLVDLKVSPANAEKFVRYAFKLPMAETFQREDIDLSDGEYMQLLQKAAGSGPGGGHTEIELPLRRQPEGIEYMEVVVFNQHLWNYVGDGRSVILLR